MDAVGRAELQRGLTRLRDGDRGAFDGVFAQLWPLFSGMARHQLGGDAEDAAQDALLKLFSRVAEFDPERDALSWALGVVAFELRTHRQRASRRREDLGASADGPAPTASPEDDVIARELQAAAAELLGTLRPGDIEILQRAARGEREPGPNFRKRLERALSRLRLAWSATHGTD